MEDKIEIGRQLSVFALSSFLNNGITFAIFNLSGYMPVIREWLMTTRNGLINGGDRNFKSFVEIPSWPDEDFELMKCKVFTIISSSTKLNRNDDKMLPVRYFYSYDF